MEFFIKKNATLPILKLQVVKDGRSDYNNMMDLIESSSIFFSMVDTESGIPKLVTRPAGFVDKVIINPNSEPEYYIYYRFTNTDTNRVGRYEGQFLLKNSDGNLILPIREKLYITIQDSFISDDLTYESCYVSEFPCCLPSNPVVTTTTTLICYINPIVPSVTPTPTPTPTPIPSSPGIYYGKFSGTTITNLDILSFTFLQTSNPTNTFITFGLGQSYGYILIPLSLPQPSEFRDSNVGCSGNIIPMNIIGTIIINDGNGFPINYNIYRTAWSFEDSSDCWLCG